MNHRSRALLKNTLIYAVGNLGSKILAFALVPLYSFYLTKDEFGFYDVVIATTTLLLPLVTMQLTDAIFRWLLTADNDEEIIRNTISNAYFFVGCNILVVILGGIVCYFFFPLKHIGLIIIMLITSTIYPVIQQSVRGLKHSKLFALSGIVYSGVFLISNIILLIVFKLSVDALFLSAILANFFGVSFLLLKKNTLRYFEMRRVRKSRIRELLYFSGPLIPNTISWWLVNSANKYIILLVLGTNANGIFALSNRFPAIMLMVNSIFILAWQESAILNFKQEHTSSFFHGILKKLMTIQFSLAVLLILSSQFIVELLIATEFQESWQYMPLLYTSVAFSALSAFYGSIYIGAKKTKGALGTSLIAGIVNVILAFLLIKSLGLFGVCLATLVAYATLFAIRVIHTKKAVPMKFPWQHFLLGTVFLLIALGITYKGSLSMQLIAFLLFIPLVILANRSILNPLLSNLRSKLSIS